MLMLIIPLHSDTTHSALGRLPTYELVLENNPIRLWTEYNKDASSDMKVHHISMFQPYSETAGNDISLIPDTIIYNQIEKIKEIYESLYFQNSEVISIAENIIYSAIEQNLFHVNIMKGEEEIILYTERTPKDFRNLLIDEDGDISYFYFAQDKSKSERKLFFKEDGLNFKLLSSLL